MSFWNQANCRALCWGPTGFSETISIVNCGESRKEEEKPRKQKLRGLKVGLGSHCLLQVNKQYVDATNRLTSKLWFEGKLILSHFFKGFKLTTEITGSSCTECGFTPIQTAAVHSSYMLTWTGGFKYSSFSLKLFKTNVSTYLMRFVLQIPIIPVFPMEEKQLGKWTEGHQMLEESKWYGRTF